MTNLVTVASVCGISAGILMGIISMTLHALKICQLCIIALGGGLYSGKMLETYNMYGLIIAWLTHFALSAVIGILIALILYYTGTKYYMVKGAVILTLIYVANIGIIATMRGVLPKTDDYFSLFLLLLYHLFFGVVAAYLISRYKDKRVI